MALSKKHYEQFAYNFKQQLDRIGNRDESLYEHTYAISQLRELAVSFAVSFALDNPRFDRQRFLAACGF